MLIIHISSASITICYPTPSPFLFGGIGGHTMIMSFDFNNGDFIIGGSTSDITLGAPVSSTVPFVAYIKGSTIIWSMLYQPLSMTISSVAALKYKGS